MVREYQDVLLEKISIIRRLSIKSLTQVSLKQYKCKKEDKIFVCLASVCFYTLYNTKCIYKITQFDYSMLAFGKQALCSTC